MFNLSVFRLHPVAMGAALALLCAPALAQSSEEAHAPRDGKKSETQAALPEVVVDDSAQTQPALCPDNKYLQSTQCPLLLSCYYA